MIRVHLDFPREGGREALRIAPIFLEASGLEGLVVRPRRGVGDDDGDGDENGLGREVCSCSASRSFICNFLNLVKYKHIQT
jgi:hypothetical protein